MAIRRLVVCFDGTWNTPDSGPEPTNVVKILRAVRNRDDRDISQFVFYDKGVGTGGFTDRIAGGASGAGLNENVVDGYRFLGNNYEDGDEIYIFGFSRGAYTARSLVGLIDLAGILKPMHLGRDLQHVVETYRDGTLARAEKDRRVAAGNYDRYAAVKIKCVGVWDTVGSLGIPGDLGRQLYLKGHHFNNVQLNAQVDVALHAVAIDEKRSAFAPTLWVSEDGQPVRRDQVVEQVWFPGVHSNVGGSYPDTGLSDTALDWMVKRVIKHTDLAFDDRYLGAVCKPRVDGIGYESRSALYLTSKYYPYERLIRQTVPEGRGFGEWCRKTFKDLDRRNVVPDGTQPINEMLHISALERWRLPEVLHDVQEGETKKQPYRPVNLEAVIRKRNIQVVDSGGEIISQDAVPWP